MVGDLAGFVASIFLRGIPYVSIPTTLLAQIDSCIGGKTGVNSAAGKNLIGAFHPPALVIADTETLRSLAGADLERGFRRGDQTRNHSRRRSFRFARRGRSRSSRQSSSSGTSRSKRPSWRRTNASERPAGAPEFWSHHRSRDRACRRLREHSPRRSDQPRHDRGRAGIGAAGRLVVRRVRRASALRCEAHQLPVVLPPDFPREKIFAALSRDKKFDNGRVRFVVAHAIGRASVADNVTMEDLRQRWRRCSRGR